MPFLIAPIFGRSLGSDLLFASGITDTTIDAAFTGASTTVTGSGTNASFAAGQVVFIHQTKGTNAGVCERNIITGYSSGTITFGIPLSNTYTSGAQIVVMKQVSSLTINAGVTWSMKAYDGTTGGILPYIVSGYILNNGTINGTGLGFRGGSSGSAGIGQNGEGTGGSQTNTRNNNGNGGGGGGDFEGSSAAGGGNGATASNGNGNASTAGIGGIAVGSADLSTLSLGGGGGAQTTTAGTAPGGNGGGSILFYTPRFINNGTIAVNGTNGATSHVTVGSGGGAGGSILIYTMRGILGSGTMTALGGAGGGGSNFSGSDGAVGRIAIAKGIITDSGTTNPAFYDKGYQTYCGMVGRG